MDFRKPKTLIVSLSAIIVAFVVVTIIITIVRYGGEINYYGTNKSATWGVNKTVGWAWDLYNFAPLFCFIVLLTFQLAYILLWILRVRLNKLVSISNLVTLLAVFIVALLDKLINVWLVILLATSSSILLVLINIIFSIVYKISDKKEKQKL